MTEHALKVGVGIACFLVIAMVLWAARPRKPKCKAAVPKPWPSSPPAAHVGGEMQDD